MVVRQFQVFQTDRLPRRCSRPGYAPEMRNVPGVLVAVVVALAVVACDSRALDGPDAFGIYFKNDLAQPVVLALCHSDHSAKCEHPSYRSNIPAGRSRGENISLDVRTEWAVETTDGRLLRCILLYWHYWPSHDEDVRLSRAPAWAWPCPRATPATPR